MDDVKDYIDISPQEGGSKGKKTTVFQDSEWRQILDNQGGLTKEGVIEKIDIWKRSNNKHVLMKYSTMLARCKCLQSSGKTVDGQIILSRDKEGVPRWVKPDVVTGLKEAPKEEPKKEKNSKKGE